MTKLIVKKIHTSDNFETLTKHIIFIPKRKALLRMTIYISVVFSNLIYFVIETDFYHKNRLSSDKIEFNSKLVGIAYIRSYHPLLF